MTPISTRSSQKRLKIVVTIQTAAISSCGPQRTSVYHTAIKSFDCVTLGVILLFVDFDNMYISKAIDKCFVRLDCVIEDW